MVVFVAVVPDPAVTVGKASAAAALSAKKRSNSLLVNDSSGAVPLPPVVG